MTAIGLCTDSSALLPHEEAELRGVAVVPVPVALDGAPFEGGADDFYRRVRSGARAATSTPSPGELLAAYCTAAERGASEAVSLHLDSRLSGVVAAAELAARESPIPVRVVDTRTASFGVALCVRAADEALRRGASAADAASLARGLGSKLRSVFVTCGAAGGRVGGTGGWTVHRMIDGRFQPDDVLASVTDAVAAVAEAVLEASGLRRVAVGHAAAEVERPAHELALRLEADSSVEAVERYRVLPPVGAHTGPLSFGAFWLPA